MNTVTITVSGTHNFFVKRWWTIKFHPTHKDSIVIRHKKNNGNISVTLYPYEEVNMGRLGRIVWLCVLKLLVVLKLL